MMKGKGGYAEALMANAGELTTDDDETEAEESESESFDDLMAGIESRCAKLKAKYGAHGEDEDEDGMM